MIQRSLKDLKIPNDPAHPLRKYIFRFIETGHINGNTWAGYTYHDEMHELVKIDRFPRNKGPHNRPMGARYRRFDNLEESLTRDELVELMREREGEYFLNIKNHPIVKDWLSGKDIEYTPSDPGFPVNHLVRRSYNDQLIDEQLRRDLLLKDDERGVVEKGNALYVFVNWESGANQWLPCRALMKVDG